MSDPLATYLADHLAGSIHAIELLKNLKDEYGDKRLGQFAGAILTDIEEDRETLKRLAERIGTGSSAIKEASAWVSEKAGRIKLSHDPDHSLGTFEALEFLTLGIHGKLALWRALASIALQDDRLQAIDFARLIGRAESQHARVEEQRLLAARSALRRNPEK